MQPHFDKFDIAEAWLVYYSQNHKGQFSESYRRLSRAHSLLKPRPNLSFESLTDNGKAIFKQLERDEKR